jgi:large subunit ribosomal protein L7/L12
MATKMTHDDLLAVFEKMTVLELSEFVKEFEERFQVSAAAPVAMAAAPGAAAPAAEEEKDEFTVMLVAAGDKKIQVIKEVRTLTSLGLKEAKALVDEAPKPVLEGVGKEEAEKAKALLEGAGATVEPFSQSPHPCGPGGWPGPLASPSPYPPFHDRTGIAGCGRRGGRLAGRRLAGGRRRSRGGRAGHLRGDGGGRLVVGPGGAAAGPGHGLGSGSPTASLPPPVRVRLPASPAPAASGGRRPLT